MMKNMYKKEYSEMLTIFYGIHVSDIISLQTKESLSNTPEPFSIISLSIPPIPIPTADATITIFDCFDLYCKAEPIEWINERTKEKEQAERSISFWSLPEIMILHLKRWNNNNTNKSKSNHLVTTPLTDVDFSKYISGYQPENYVYDLFGVCNHLGGASGGHYTAYIKNANGKWYECNDTEVKEINSENIISTHSYCLFYRKKNKHT
jgi:ubiquitin C-terminal hydrolase